VLRAGEVRVRLAPATDATPRALLRVKQPAIIAGVGGFRPRGDPTLKRGAWVIRLAMEPTEVVLVQR